MNLAISNEFFPAIRFRMFCRCRYYGCSLYSTCTAAAAADVTFHQLARVLLSRVQEIYGGFIKGILRGVRCTKSLRVLFLHRRPPSRTTRVLYSRAVFFFNEPAYTPWYTWLLLKDVYGPHLLSLHCLCSQARFWEWLGVLNR